MNPPTVSRKDEILQAATRLFSQRGYHATTIREIARAVEIEGGSLYSHISSKQDLLRDIVLRASVRFTRVGRAIAESEAAPAEKLQTFMRTHLEIIAESIEAAVVYFHEWRHLDESALATIKQQRDEYEGYLRQILQAGRAARVFAYEDERLLSKYIFSLLNWPYQWYRPDGPLNAEQLSQKFFQQLMHGLQAQTKSSPGRFSQTQRKPHERNDRQRRSAPTSVHRPARRRR